MTAIGDDWLLTVEEDDVVTTDGFGLAHDGGFGLRAFCTIETLLVSNALFDDVFDGEDEREDDVEDDGLE